MAARKKRRVSLRQLEASSAWRGVADAGGSRTSQNVCRNCRKRERGKGGEVEVAVAVAVVVMAARAVEEVVLVAVVAGASPGAGRASARGCTSR